MNQQFDTQQQRDQFVQDLTCAMSSGSDSAYRRFFELYYDRLYRHLLYLTAGNEDLTRDLVQTVLLRVVRYLKVFPGERVFWAWLRQVCRSCHIDWLRRNGHELEPVSLQVAEALPSTDNANDEEQELISLLDTALAQLDPREREAVRLAYFEGATHKELAAQWNTTPKAIESRLARIRDKLRKSLIERLKTYALL